MKPTEWLMDNIRGVDYELAVLFRELEENGAEIVFPGDVPSWMEEVQPSYEASVGLLFASEHREKDPEGYDEAVRRSKRFRYTKAGVQ